MVGFGVGKTLENSVVGVPKCPGFFGILVASLEFRGVRAETISVRSAQRVLSARTRFKGLGPIGSEKIKTGVV